MTHETKECTAGRITRERPLGPSIRAEYQVRRFQKPAIRDADEGALVARVSPQKGNYSLETKDGRISRSLAVPLEMECWACNCSGRKHKGIESWVDLPAKLKEDKVKRRKEGKTQLSTKAVGKRQRIESYEGSLNGPLETDLTYGGEKLTEVPIYTNYGEAESAGQLRLEK
ncbi:hypothetical protein QQ045_010142 [Rhodiola kirilowii]